MYPLSHAHLMRMIRDDMPIAKSGYLMATTALYDTLNGAMVTDAAGNRVGLVPRGVVPNMPTLQIDGEDYELTQVQPDGQSFIFTSRDGSRTKTISQQQFLRTFGPPAAAKV